MNKALRLVSAEVEKEVSEEDTADLLATLIAGIRDGDEASLENLYEATVDRILALTRRILGAGPDAEEVTEDVYLYVWRNATRYDPNQGHPLAWLLTLARSRAIDRYRYQAKHNRIGNALANQPVSEIVEEEPLTLLYGTRLRTCIESLPQVQRQVLTMAYFRGMTHAEIAQDLAMSLGTVKTHIRRTLIALRLEVDA